MHIEDEECWLARWRDPEGHATALKHMDILAGKESGEESFAVKSSAVQPWRRHGEEEDEDRGSSAAGPRRRAVQRLKGTWAQEQLTLPIDNYRSVGYAENQPAVFKSDASFYSFF